LLKLNKALRSASKDGDVERAEQLLTQALALNDTHVASLSLLAALMNRNPQRVGETDATFKVADICCCFGSIVQSTASLTYVQTNKHSNL
jgi:outer membrane PBP1 activator LpoA protein